MSVVSTLLAQQVYNWQLEDFACFRKCGEITVSPDAQTYGMNCRFCAGICLQFDVFIEHIREVHAERVSALYQQTDACGGEAKCEQSTQTPNETELETYNDYDDDAAFIAAIANHTADGDVDGDHDDFDIDVECIDGGDECAFNCNYNNAVVRDDVADANVGSDTDTDSATNATAQVSLPPRRYPQRHRRRTAVVNGGNDEGEDKPRKLCRWNEAPSAKCNGTLGKYKTLTNTQTPPTPAPTPSPWTTPVQNVKDGNNIVHAFENESETATIAMDTPDTLDISLAAAQIDMSALLGDEDDDDDVDMQAHNSVPEAPQAQVDLVYIMESATPDGVIEEETVVDPFEMAQGWRRSTDSSECPENDVPSPYSNRELRRNLIALPLNTSKTPNGEKPLVNENEHSTEVIFYLLEAYKKNEKLWNPNHSQYKYNANRKMFEELSRPLLRDMNYSLDGSEIYAIIKSLRSRYRLELAKARERKGKYKTRFKYFEKMEFLRDIIENKRAARRVKKQLDSSDKSLDEDCTESTRSTHNRTVLTYLLDAFRRQESLWNPQHPNYLLCNKNELMREISINLLLEKDVNMTADECATEIQKLRTRFRRELRIVHEQKGLYAPKLWCFEQMEFLQKIFEDQLCDRLKKRKGVIACKPKIQYLKAKSIEFKSNDDHLTFIEIYKSYSALWDVEHPDYRSTTYRNEELNQMLEEVNLMLGIDSTLEELQKTLYEMRKEFSAEKHKRLVETTQNNTTPPPPPPSIIQTKLMEFLDVNLGPFRCDVCAELIKTSDQYKIHKSGHDGMQPFICTLCGKGFQIPGNLTIHIRRHKGDFPYACEVCDKKFATSTEVAIHMRSHTGERPYICSFCGKSFKTWSFYDTHRRAHLNQSNFHCPICDKAFYERNRYTDHMNGHLNIRKHVCDVCGKAYTTFANLKKHNELHLPVKKYKCDICGQRFAQFASVRWHKRKTHAQAQDKRHEQMEQ
ncbi:uncharacterized protein LOC120770767 [Bactrocera tryoni]|uniref:uncharacterized protein LOC120770767 n=1 Tax=Bactrocera tryoni TaxID=59916 RepID=UPI001A969E31|nr:uncharacterized protein LOC120770767 [Bactrocera tryoni]